MKKTIILLLPVLLAIGSIAQSGQGNRPPGKRGTATQQNAKGMQGLNLTAEQQKQQKELQNKFREQMKALEQNEDITVKEQRDRKEKMMKQHRSEMQNLLTPDQQKQMAERRASSDRMRKLNSQMQMERAGAKLNLSAEQIAQLQANREKNLGQMKGIRNNENLDRVARQKQMETLRRQHNTDLAKVLNKEQLAQWKDMQQKNRNNMRQQGRGGRNEMHRGGGRSEGYGNGRGMKGQQAK